MIDIHDDSWMKRDYFGYGPDRPDAKWPNGAKIAVNCGSPSVTMRHQAELKSSSIMKKEARGPWKMEMSMLRRCCMSTDKWYVFMMAAVVESS